MSTQGALFDVSTAVEPSDPPPVILSYGMGVESTTALLRMIQEPDFRPLELENDLSNLIVLTAQTGDEFTTVCDLVARFVLPMLREHQIRFVEVARAGPSEADGIVVLQDTRSPQRVHPDPEESGYFSLSAENRRNGVMPQLASRACSAKAKGFPLDSWRAREIGSRKYIHAVGFNADEGSRILTDSAVTLGGNRCPVYPIDMAGLSRQDCEDYLYGRFGVWWPKSCCRQCCFVSKRSWPAHLARMRGEPFQSARHVVDEYTTVALNKNSALFGRNGSLAARLRRDGAHEILSIAEEALDQASWALYRVRRIYFAKAVAWRSVDVAYRDDRAGVHTMLNDVAALLNIAPLTEGGHSRLWLAQRGEGRYPCTEQFFVPAPATVIPKQRPGFDPKWAALAAPTIDMDIAAADAITHLATIGRRPAALVAGS